MDAESVASLVLVSALVLSVEADWLDAVALVVELGLAVDAVGSPLFFACSIALTNWLRMSVICFNKFSDDGVAVASALSVALTFCRSSSADFVRLLND